MFTKTKTKIAELWRKFRKDAIYILIIANLVIYSISFLKGKEFYNNYVNLSVNEASAEMAKEESQYNEYEKGSLDWILSECEKNGIDPIKVKCLLKHESGFNNNAISAVRTPENVDLGLFQWSEKYQIKTGFISLGCIGNPECELQKFIEKVKKDGNMYAWVGYKNNCMWLEK
jgi:hypothetical protein